MKRTTTLLFALTLTTLMSCSEPNSTSQDKPPTEENQKVEFMAFSSEENGVAQIDLRFFNDQSFSYNMTILPQPLSDDTAESIYSTGIWANRGNKYRLTFTNELIDVTTLFDTTQTSIESIVRNQVTIDLSSETLTIWGVKCGIIK